MSDNPDLSYSSRSTRSRGPPAPHPHLLPPRTRSRRTPLDSTTDSSSSFLFDDIFVPPVVPEPLVVPAVTPQIPLGNVLRTLGPADPEQLSDPSDLSSDNESVDPLDNQYIKDEPSSDSDSEVFEDTEDLEDPENPPEDPRDSDNPDDSEESENPEDPPEDPEDPEDPPEDPEDPEDPPEDPEDLEKPKMTDTCKLDIAALRHRNSGFEKILKEHLDQTHELTLPRAKLLLDDMKELARELATVHSDCFKHHPNVKANTADQYTPLQVILGDYNPVYTLFLKLRAQATDIVEDLTVQHGTGLKPPKLSLPTFKGIHGEWPTFKSAFTALVRDCNKFSPCEKLRLLKEALHSPADDTLKDLQATDGNWTIAWDRLTERYDSPREAAHAAVKPLLELPALMSQTGNGIHKLLATVRTTKAQIRLINLGTVTEADVLYTHFVLARLDIKTIKEFNQSLTGNNVPSLDTLTTWLERQAKSIDLTHEIKNNTTRSLEPRPSRDRRNQPVLTIQNTKQITRSHSPGPKGRSSSHQQRREVIKPTIKHVIRAKTPPVNNQTAAKTDQRPRQQYSRAASPHTSTCTVCDSTVHRTNQCPEFLGYSINERRDWIRSNNRCFNCLGNHSVKVCTSKYTCSKCQKRHHSLIHSDESLSTIMTLSSKHNQIHGADPFNVGILPTAVVTVTNANGNELDQARCLLDTGAERCFITAAAVKRLGLPIQGRSQHFIVAGGRTTSSPGYVVINLRNRNHQTTSLQVQASVLSQITCCIPGQPIETDTWSHIQGLPLADPTFNIPGHIDILLGTGFVDFITRGRKIEGPPGQPSAYLTEFGYVLQGHTSATPVCTVMTVAESKGPEIESVSQEQPQSHESSLFQMQKFWEIEDIPQKMFLTPMEQECEDHFTKNTIRLRDGRFQVKWPFIASPRLLGQSYKAALSRWMSMERKLIADPALAADYHGQLDDYLQNGQLELIPADEMHVHPHYWIPHHAVFKPSSTTTKIRIVFDASAKTSSGKSMNALLAPGPVIQAPLLSQLINFRLKRVGMTADIARMYRQVYVEPSERDLARIIWRKSPAEPLQYYRHKSIPFGFASSPYLATRCLQKLAREESERYPLAAQALLNSFYVDDFLCSEESVTTAIKFKDELLALLETAHMNLRKWSSNSSELLESLPTDMRETQLPLDMNKNATIGTLGMRWNPATDTFQYTVALPSNDNPTKRSVLSDISKIFDPLGLLAPTIIVAKILMQRIWTFPVTWDDPLPQPVLAEWHSFSKTMPELEQITIPRWLGSTSTDHLELHGFCDASEQAYAAAIYMRTTKDTSIVCHLITSKSRVAPIKTTTIPRLELQGAVLLAELMAHVRQQFKIPHKNIFFWTDSTICLHWIHSHPSKWKIYVANRVTQILETSTSVQWNHVKSEENPADLSSRGLPPTDLLASTLWWHGPHWLAQNYPKNPFMSTANEDPLINKELKPIKTLPPILLATCNKDGHYVIGCLSRISSWTKAVRVTALLLAIKSSRSFHSIVLPLMASQHIAAAENHIIKLIQALSYPDLGDAITDKFTQGKYTEYRVLQKLHLFVAKDGIFRVGGRLQRSNLPFNTRHPALVPGNHPLVRALIFHTHKSLAHAGRLSVHNHLRQKFWIPNATKSIKSVIDKCILCFRYHAQSTTQLMGQLPAARVNTTRPFLHTGVDFFGPYELRTFTGRTGKYKVWVALFTCMATRAIHLELVSTLSQFGFLLAFRRFISRRGKPTHMYSDNGTNFVGATTHLKQVRTRQITAQALTNTLIPDLEMEEIKWHFNPPAAPAQGGVWESCVKLVKTHLRTIVSDDSHTWEMFESLLIFVEAIVNSRPLTPVSEDPNDLEALTPAHFLIGITPIMISEDDLTHLKVNRLDQYQLVIRRQQDLWRRWQKEYITALQKRPKWNKEQSNLAVDQMVLIMDDQCRPMQWRIGRVKRIHPGSDGLVRVTTVETDTTYQTVKGKLTKTYKEVTRPITKLAKIPIDEDEQNDKYKALPYPNQYPAVTTVVRPHRLARVSSWNWIHTLMAITASHISGTSGLNLANQTIIPSLKPTGAFPYPIPWANIVVTLLIMFAIVGICGNLVTIIALARSPKLMSNPIHWFIISLCTSDLLFSSTSIPLAIMRLRFRRWMFSDTVCHLSAILLFGNIMCTLAHLVSITVNRYVKIVHTQWYPQLYSKRTIGLIIGLSWTLPFASLIPTMFGYWGTLGPKPTDRSCCTIIPDTAGRSPITLLWTLGNLLPLGIIMWCYIHILIHVRRSRVLIRRLSGDTPPTALSQKHNHTLTRMTCFIVGGYLLAFEPVLILNWFDDAETNITPSIHLLSAVMAWSTSWLNLLVYVTTNRDYRQAYINLFMPRRATRLSSSSTRTTATSMTRIIVSLVLLGTTMASHEPSPDLSTKATICDQLWPAHHVIPACIQQVNWLHIQSNGSVCSRTKQCSLATDMVSPDASQCITPTQACTKRQTLNLDHVQCQTVEDTRLADLLLTPPLRSTLCSVDQYTLRSCAHHIDQHDTVPIAIIRQQAYPLDTLQIAQIVNMKNLSSYTCRGGACKNNNCEKTLCTGDSIFCAHFKCHEIHQFRNGCECVFNRSSIVHIISTPNGSLTPSCWGTFRVPIKRETWITQPIKHSCDDCVITCTATGINIRTPGRVSRYIRILKNPGHISTIPSSTTTAVHFTQNMLATSGPMTVEIWFQDFDMPSIRELTCPRVPICSLIQCHVCIERWLNVSCYSSYHWLILACLGFIITGVILISTYMIRTAMNISWYILWPVRCLIRAMQRYRKSRPTTKGPKDLETETELLPIPPNPYATSTKGIRRHRHRSYLISIFAILALLASTAYACSNFAMLSASTTECDYTQQKRVCKIRINTRLAISPIGQQSCLRMDDSRDGILGTITLQTQAISVRCQKELLYYIPRTDRKCDNSRQCFNVIGDRECTYNSCANFELNSTIKDFEHRANNLGWSSCISVLPGCFWPMTHDCHFTRVSLINPTRQTYAVYTCPEWTYAATLRVQFHLGHNVTTNVVTLYPGKKVIVNQVEFSLISATIPPSPILDDCFITNEHRMAMTTCNKRGEVMTNRVGEVQCNSIDEAQDISKHCLGNRDLVQTQIDDNGIRCTADFVDPEQVLNANPLPLKLSSGILLPYEDSVSYEISGSALLEIQLNTEALNITQEVETVQCDVQFIKLTGCYSCTSGATLFLQGQTRGGSTTATVECPAIGYFTPFHITPNTTTYQLIMKVDKPDIVTNCSIKCSQQSSPIVVTGHLQYLQNKDVREEKTEVIHEPSLDPFAGFSLFSLYGSNWYSWIQRGFIILIIIIVVYITLTQSLKLVLKKLV